MQQIIRIFSFPQRSFHDRVQSPPVERGATQYRPSREFIEIEWKTTISIKIFNSLINMVRYSYQIHVGFLFFNNYYVKKRG